MNKDKEKELLKIYANTQTSILNNIYSLFARVEDDGKWTYSNVWKYDRYNKLIKEIQGFMKELGNAENKFFIDTFIEDFNNTYADTILKLEGIKVPKAPFEKLKELDKEGSIINTVYSIPNKKIIEEIASYPWSGADYSDRIWREKDKLLNNLKDTLTDSMLKGESIQKVSSRIQNTMGSSCYNSTRLARTEVMRMRNESKVKAYIDNGVEELEWDASPEQSRTCDVCRGRNGEKYTIDKLPTMPAHPHCRCTWLPVLESSINSNIFEKEKTAKKGNYNSVNWDLVNSKEYKEKFKGVTDNEGLNNLLCEKARDILKHRNNTNYEDFYLFDSIDVKLKAAQTHSKGEFVINYNKEILKAIDKSSKNTLISMHNHPTNNLPSGGDWDSMQENGYKKGIIVCHNGEVFTYSISKKLFNGKLFDLYVDKYSNKPYNLSEREAFIKVLEEFKVKYNIKYEVL